MHYFAFFIFFISFSSSAQNGVDILKGLKLIESINSPRSDCNELHQEKMNIVCSNSQSNQKEFYLFECSEKDKRKCHPSIKEKQTDKDKIFLILGLGNDDVIMSPVFAPAAYLIDSLNESTDLAGNDEGISHALKLGLEIKKENGNSYEVYLVSGIETMDTPLWSMLSTSKTIETEKYKNFLKLLTSEQPHLKIERMKYSYGEYDVVNDNGEILRLEDAALKYLNLPDSYKENLQVRRDNNFKSQDERRPLPEVDQTMISYSEKTNLRFLMSHRPKGNLLHFKVGGGVFMKNINKRSSFGAGRQQDSWHKLLGSANATQYFYDGFKGKTEYGAALEVGLGLQKTLNLGGNCVLENSLDIESHLSTDGENLFKVSTQSQLQHQKIGVGIRTSLTDRYGLSAGTDLSYKFKYSELVFSMDKRPDNFEYTGYLSSQSEQTLNDFYYKMTLRIPINHTFKKGK